MGATINTRLHFEINEISRVIFARMNAPHRNRPRGASIDPRQDYRKTRLLKSKQNPPARSCLAAIYSCSFLFELICFEGTSSWESPLSGNESPTLLFGLSSRLLGLFSRLSAAFAVSIQCILGV
jgi:hypothetical protein